MCVHIYRYTYIDACIYIICVHIYRCRYIHILYIHTCTPVPCPMVKSSNVRPDIYTHIQICTFTYIYYGMATISRLLKIIGLFCRISSLFKGFFAKETYDFKGPTNRSHPIYTSQRTPPFGQVLKS